jgi:hypothetical protein
VIVQACDDTLVHECAHLIGLTVQTSPVEDGTFDIEVSRLAMHYRVDFRSTSKIFTTSSDMRIYFITSIGSAMLSKTNLLIVHAGGILKNGRAILFSGPGRVGKSTLVLAAWCRGHTIIGDDWLVVEPLSAHVEPFPKPLKPRMASCAAPPEVVQRTAARDRLAGSLEGEDRLLIGRCASGMVPLGDGIPIERLIFLERNIANRTQISALTGRDALSSFLGQFRIPNARSGLAIIGLLKVLLQAGSVHRLSVAEGDTERALELAIAASNQST